MSQSTYLKGVNPLSVIQTIEPFQLLLDQTTWRKMNDPNLAQRLLEKEVVRTRKNMHERIFLVALWMIVTLVCCLLSTLLFAIIDLLVLFVLSAFLYRDIIVYYRAVDNKDNPPK